MSRVLITGGGGFIGRHVVRGLIREGHDVHVAGKSSRHETDGVWHQVDLLEAPATERLLAEVRPEVMIHLAWYTNPVDYRSSPHNLEWVEASIRLIRLFAAVGGRRFVGAGSCAEYDHRFGYCSESMTPSNPSSLYGVCKNAVNDVIASASDELGVEPAWVRIFFPYGPGEPSSKLVSYVVNRLLQGLPAECTAGNQFRDYIYVGDVAELILKVLDSSEVGVFNVGSGIPVTVAQIAMTIGGILGAPELIHLGVREAPADDPPMLVANMHRVRRALAWEPSVGLEDGLGETVDFLKWDGRREFAR